MTEQKSVKSLRDQHGPFFGEYGGRFMPESLIAAIDEALAAQPDVLAKIKDGKVQAAGAVIGAVMKAMKGQADAARVRELVLVRAAE